MKRMKEINVKALFAFVTDVIDVEAIPLDDQKTYHLLAVHKILITAQRNKQNITHNYSSRFL